MKLEDRTKRRNKIFDSKYIVKENGCWEWQGLKTRCGYGSTGFRKEKKEARISAHRFSFERYKGKIPIGCHICHNCPGGDNRLCVNPDHLWLGTSFENMRDKGLKGSQCKGETHGQHKLTESQVREIRHRYLNGEKGPDLAKEFNVSTGLIYHIKNGKAWKFNIIGDECEILKKIVRNNPVKLNEQNIKDIRNRYKNGERVTDLAKQFKVNTTMISRIKNGKAWKYVS